MSKIIKKLERLINSLPKKDIELGKTFLKRRNFDSLKELVDSALYKVEKSQNSDTPNALYSNIDIDSLNKLKLEIDLYMVQVDMSFENDYNELDYEPINM